MLRSLAIPLLLLFASFGCRSEKEPGRLLPDLTTEPVQYDTDDPAIWIHPEDPEKSLILGTDKETDGALYAFDLQGKIANRVGGIHRPNNVDVEYGFAMPGGPVDIAVLTEREHEGIRIFQLPDLTPIDGGGLRVFEGENGDSLRAPMGVALYKKPGTDSVYVILSRKFGPPQGYLWQYLLTVAPDSTLQLQLVRKFGAFSGKAEIEAIAVDDELGYVYYADEMAGLRKYYADPARGNEELAFFGQNDFQEDSEGIAILNRGNGEGYLLVSDQQAAAFNVYPRAGAEGDPHQHPLLKKLWLSTDETDGCEISGAAFGQVFPRGFFVAMSADKTFQVYRLERLGLE